MKTYSSLPPGNIEFAPTASSPPPDETCDMIYNHLPPAHIIYFPGGYGRWGGAIFVSVTFSTRWNESAICRQSANPGWKMIDNDFLMLKKILKGYFGIIPKWSKNAPKMTPK